MQETVSDRCCLLADLQARMKVAQEGVNGWITGPLGLEKENTCVNVKESKDYIQRNHIL